MSLITAFFTENGTPKTGLSPTIDIWDSDGSLIVNGAAMTEIAGGFYKYDFSVQDDTVDYVFRADGTTTLPPHERFNVGTNEASQVKTDTGNLVKIETNRWKISEADNTLTIFDDDGTTPLFVFDLKDARGRAAVKNVFERVPQ